MNAELLIVLTAIVAVGVVLAMMIRNQAPVTLTTATEAYTHAQTLQQELADVARVAVTAAEQLKESGQIEKSEALDHAVDHINRWFAPMGVELDTEVVINAAEAAYFGLKILKAQMDKPAVAVSLPVMELGPIVKLGPPD